MVYPLLQELPVYRAISYYGVPVFFVHVVARLYGIILLPQAYSFIGVTFQIKTQWFAIYTSQGKNFTFHFEA
jgi:hypothetical protein